MNSKKVAETLRNEMNAFSASTAWDDSEKDGAMAYHRQVAHGLAALLQKEEPFLDVKLFLKNAGVED